MKNFIISLVLLVFLPSIIQKEDKAKKIIDLSIESYGGENFNNFEVHFTFRNFQYKLKQKQGVFHYQRNFVDKDGSQIEDILTNEGFSRKVNGNQIKISDKEYKTYSNSVNSVAYFVLLPYKLKDTAVNYSYIGETIIENEKYHKVKVWFNREGGGNDYNDIYCYWFNQKTNTLDYLAYKNGGPRFRKAYNRKSYKGITFQDYENYEHKDTLVPVMDYDKIFKDGKMKLLSKIEQTDIEVVR